MHDRSFASYPIEGVVSTSGPGPVYRATDPATRQPVLLHTLRPEHPAGSPVAREFLRRQRAAAQVSSHPRTWRLAGSGVYRGVSFFALTGPAGQPLSSYARGCWERSTTGRGPDGNLAHPEAAHGAISPWMIRNWMGDLASAVDYAHQQGVIFGNLSPYTAWIAEDGAAMVADPGSMGELDWQLESHPGERERGVPDRASFLAPEQLLRWPVGPHSDVYSLGAILFWLLGGEFPPRRHSDAIQIGRYLPLLPLRPTADPLLSAICKKATTISSASRYGSADLMRAALQATAGDILAARSRAAHGARLTMVRRGTDKPPASDPESLSAGQSLLARWLQGWR